jgi:hypothetical protein
MRQADSQTTQLLQQIMSVQALPLTHLPLIKNSQTNLDMYRSLLQIQANMPPQVLRDQPVHFEDAMGQTTPFFLEFFSSKEVG